MMVGFSYTAFPDSLSMEFENFLSHANILDCSRSVADKYGKIFAELRKKGSLIPVNDIWIAASCITFDRTLATRDAHFQKVPGLKIEMW